MKTMNTQKVAQWLDNQGLAEASKTFLATFGHMPEVDHGGIEGFLFLYYGEFSSEVFRSMQCQVSTNLTIE